MHIWTHRRFHDAEGKYFRYWLDVRTRIQHLMTAKELTVDEVLQIWVADKTAAALDLSMTWEKTEDGVIIGMGKSNEEGISNALRRF